VKIGVIGAGSWGTSLSIVLAENGHDVTMWTHEKEVIEDIFKNKVNSKYLPVGKIPDNLVATNVTDFLAKSDIFIIAIPTQFIRTVFMNYNFRYVTKKPFVSVAKGIEQVTLLRVSEIFEEISPGSIDNFAVLTGPSHAEEVALKVPTTVVISSDDHGLSKSIQSEFSNAYFRVYSADDVIGAELGGALKNVIAIAAGLIDGLELGDNTKAALLTRGLAEISRLGVALGANPQTFSGLSGLGDLMVTCNSRHSRNRFVGEQIGRGKTLKGVRETMSMVAEGITTTDSAYQLGLQHKVEMPITEQVFEILFHDKPPLEAMKELMNRRTRREWWW
jgi:glycerol-3-phosphate dehydrogenase (NAD(P)+)